MDGTLKTIIRFLANPFVLSIIPAIILIIIIPIRQEKYFLELETHIKLPANTYFYYDDLDGDGYSEMIRLMHFFSRTRFTVYQHGGAAIDEWGIDGTLDFVEKANLVISGDYNNNGIKELFFFTLSNDSIFLHGPFDFRNAEGAINKRFVARVGPGKPNPDPKIIHAEMEDLDGDGAKELIFGTFTGYSLYPRQVFGYFIDNDSLIASPESFYQAMSILQADITGDGKREILLSGAAPSNVSPSLTRYHDHSNWLIVLDQNLQFLFEPVEIPGKFNGLRTLVLPGAGGTEIGCITGPVGNRPPVFLRFSIYGELLEEILLRPGIEDYWVSKRKDGYPVIGLTVDKTDLGLFDTNFNMLKRIPSKGFFNPQTIDLNGDGHLELIAFNQFNSQLHVYRPGFRHPASAGIEWFDKDAFNISVRRNGALPPQISFQVGRDHYLFNYGANPYYYLRYLFYLGMYLSVLLFAWLMQRLQKRQILRAFATEKKITELQLSLVKNQLDPHFSLNVLNSVIQAIRENKPGIAEEGLMRFAGLYRNMLLTAGDLRRSLEEELTFTENYLALEQLRYGNAFEYETSVHPGVDMSIAVPRMIVQVYAENAVKHGLAPLKSGGKLWIEVAHEGESLVISISDNGVGREISQNERQNMQPGYNSTGKGLELMQEFYELYRRYYKQRITCLITDREDNNGMPAGTIVRITIFLQDEDK